MKKAILSGLLAGLVMLVLGLAVGRLFDLFAPGLVAEYNNPALFRPWSDPLMSLYFLQPFLVALILAWFWTKLKGLVRGTNALEKGLFFGLAYWLLIIPGMLMTYSSFPLSLLIVFSWTVIALIQGLAAGWIFAKMLK